MSELHYRAVGGLEPDFTGRTLAGKLIPFGESRMVNAPGFRGKEAFAPSAFGHQMTDAAAARIPLFMDHGPLGGKLIGRMQSLSAKPDGLYGRAIISDTADGKDAMSLIRDGVYPGLSIGFREGTNVHQADGTVLRTKADMTELAVVREGAYSDALIHALRSARPQCPKCGSYMPDDTGDAPDVVDDDAGRSRHHPELVLPVLRPMGLGDLRAPIEFRR